VKTKAQFQFITIILFLFIIFTFILFPAAGTQDSQKVEWKGEITTEKGVKVVKNPREPLYGEIKLELKEDLSIGREEDENYLFYMVRGIALDSFSKDGYFLYKSTIPRGTYIIKDGFLYAYVMDEDSGEELVKRFRIKNWDQIKY